MSEFTCIVQRDQAAHRATDQLGQGLRAAHRRFIDDKPVAITWMVAEPGDMFTAGEPSTSSIVGAAIDRETTAAEREQLLTAICDLWTDVTGCTDHEILAAVTRPEQLSSR